MQYALNHYGARFLSSENQNYSINPGGFRLNLFQHLHSILIMTEL